MEDFAPLTHAVGEDEIQQVLQHRMTRVNAVTHSKGR